jgi:hypothetical protein
MAVGWTAPGWTVVASSGRTAPGWTVVASSGRTAPGWTVVASSGRIGGCALAGWTGAGPRAAGWPAVSAVPARRPILVPSSIVAGPEASLKSVLLPS